MKLLKSFFIKFLQKSENHQTRLHSHRRGENLTETEVQEMQTETDFKKASQHTASDEEVSDLLIAISVVTKRLAQKINEKSETKKGVHVCTEHTMD